MKRQIIKILMVIITTYNLQSCALLIGVKKIKPLSENKINKQATKFNIPLTDSYSLDTSYMQFVYNATKDNARKRNDYLQPLQAIYFTKENDFITPISCQINCYAGGFPNLQWNRNGIMEVFPPKEQAPIDSVMSLKKQFEFIRPLIGVTAFNSIEYDYIIMVYWSRFMGRQSKKLIETVQKNAKLETIKKWRIIYINNDNFFGKMDS
jgi:hypothetical protein